MLTENEKAKLIKDAINIFVAAGGLRIKSLTPEAAQVLEALKS